MKNKHVESFGQFNENLNISDVRKSKLNNGRFYLIQEDGGDQLHFTGIYDNLESFTNDIKDNISQKENIDISEIEIEFVSDEILVKYEYSKDIFYYEEISINEIYPV